MAGAGRGVGQAAVGHAQQRSTRLMIDQVDLDQARLRRHRFAAIPAEAVGEAVDRNDLREPPAGDVLAGDVDEVKPAGMRLYRRFCAHPPQNLFRIGEESEDGRWRRCDLDLTPDQERFNHRKPPSARARARCCVSAARSKWASAPSASAPAATGRIAMAQSLASVLAKAHSIYDAAFVTIRR